MSTNVSEYTFEKMLEFNSSSVEELLRKLQDSITVQEYRVKYRNEIKSKASNGNELVRIRISDDKRGCNLYTGKTGHKQIRTNWINELNKYDIGNNELARLNDIKQRVLLNQSLRSIEHTIFPTNDEFKYNVSDFPQRPKGKRCKPYESLEYHDNWLNDYWFSKSLTLTQETEKLESALNEFKNQLSMKKYSKPKKPEIIKPEIVAASGLIPLGIIGILLINSSEGKK